jgi:hypothetical protein
MIISGAELRAFIANGWPGDEWYWDVEAFDDLPDSMPIATETYDTNEIVDRGELKWQGVGHHDPLVLDDVIAAWRKARDYDVVSVMVPKARYQDFLSAIQSVGASVPTVTCEN